MSIEQEKIDGASAGSDGSLEQYGVWVKKASDGLSDEGLDDLSELTNAQSDSAIENNDVDFSLDSEDIFSDDLSDFDFENSIQPQSEDEDDSDDTTLTTDELLNITNDIDLSDLDDAKAESIETDFDSFMDIDALDNDSTHEEVVESSDAGEDVSFDDFMVDGLEASAQTEMDDDLVVDIDSDDLDIAFDDFITDESGALETENESLTSDSMDIDFDSDVTSSITLGEEITIDDIPNNDDDIDSTVYSEEASSDYNLDIETTAEKRAINTSSDNTTAVSSMLLDKIVTELSELRNEMAEFKGELRQIKAGKQKSSDTQEEGGFFSDYEGDDTIALSGDELNNILTSADFTVDDEAETTESSNEAIHVVEDEDDDIQVINDSIDDDISDSLDIEEFSDDFFGNDGTTLSIDDSELQEPNFDDVSFDDLDEEEETLPDEIEVPVIDDLVVDSSPTDFFDDEEQEKEIDDTAMQFLADDTPLDSEGERDARFVFDEAEDNTFNINEEISTDIDEDGFMEDSSLDDDSPAQMSNVFTGNQWETKINENDFESTPSNIHSGMQEEIKSVLTYMDRLLESLPEDKISEFAQSEYFGRYKKLFTDLGIS